MRVWTYLCGILRDGVFKVNPGTGTHVPITESVKSKKIVIYMKIPLKTKSIYVVFENGSCPNERLSKLEEIEMEVWGLLLFK
jgi:hypothetical protein